MGRSQSHRYWWTAQNPVDNDVLQTTSGKHESASGLWCFSLKKHTRVLDRVSVQFFEMGFMPYSKLCREKAKVKQLKPDMLLSSKSRIVVHL